jgi:membrane-associated protease RseP (regulator of RpoE activity)
VFLEMDNQTVDDGIDANLIPALSYGNEPMIIHVRRDNKDVWVKVDPKAAPGGRLEGLRTLGADGDFNLTVGEIPPESMKYLSKLFNIALLSGRLEVGDRIVQARPGDEPFRDVRFWSDLARMGRDSSGQNLTLKIRRKDGTTAEAVLKCELRGASTEAFQLLGAHPRVKVDGVSEKMPATGKLKEGDVILSAGGIDYPLETQIRQAVKHAGESDLTMKILRDGKEETVKIKPLQDWLSWLENQPPKIGILMTVDGDLAALGQVSTDKALGNLPSGAEIMAVRLVTTQPEKRSTTQPSAATRPEPAIPLASSQSDSASTGATSRPAVASQPEAKPLTWSQFYRSLVAAAGHKVVIVYRLYGKVDTATVDVPPLDDWQKGVTFRPVPLIGLLEPLTKMFRADNPIAAVGMGARKLSQMIVQVYVTLDRLIFRQSVGVKQLYGPIGIAVATYHTAKLGMMDLFYFLAMISANLAVINFLPLPIVDGGLMAFLIAEKIRGKPVSVRVVQISQVVGIVLILGLFLMVTWQDIVRFILPLFHG